MMYSLYRFKSLGPVLWIGSRYQFRVLMSFLHVPMVFHCAELGDINICIRACVLFFEMFDIIYHTF